MYIKYNNVYISQLILSCRWLLSRFPYLRVVANKDSIEPRVPYCLVLNHHFEGFTDAIMTWLTAENYLCHMWPRICSIFRNHNPSFFLLSWRIIEFFIFKGYTTWVTSGLFALTMYTTGVSSGLFALTLYTTGVPSGLFALTLFVPGFGGFVLLHLYYTFLCSVLWTIFSLFCPFSSCHCIVCLSIRDFWLPLCIFIFFLAKAINIKALHNTDITDVTDVDSFLIVLKLNHLLILVY